MAPAIAMTMTLGARGDFGQSKDLKVPWVSADKNVRQSLT
jgi:hypothetical protein